MTVAPLLDAYSMVHNAGAALLTRVELGWGGQGPGGGQGGLGAQQAGQEGRCATWEGWGVQTDTLESSTSGSPQAVLILAHSSHTDS